MSRQLHKRRLAPAPRPYLLPPVEHEPQITPLQQTPVTRPGTSHSSKSGAVTQYSADGHRLNPEPTLAGGRSLELQFTGMAEPCHQEPSRRVESMRPSLGHSPRLGSTRPDTTLDVPAGADFGATQASSIFEVDGQWVKSCVDFKKPDGRDYQIHQKRLNPPPAPVLGPSVYMQELAPEYAQQQQQLEYPTSNCRKKHDFISFLTTGKLPPGPSLHQMAACSQGLQERFDSIHSTNQQVHCSVETLWRMKQSWGMQRAEALQWSSKLERPKVLTESPSRSFRTNVGIHHLTSKVARDGKCQRGYELTPGTLVHKGRAPVKINGQWSMFRGEPQALNKPPPEDFNSQKEVQKELRKQKLNQKKKKKPEEQAVTTAEQKPKLTEAELNNLMSSVMLSVNDLQLTMKEMQQEIHTLDPSTVEDPEKDEDSEPSVGLGADIAATKHLLEDRKQMQGGKGMTGVMYLGEGRFQELVVRDSVDADDDDLEDRIRKPRHLTLTERIVPHRDCFKLAQERKVRNALAI